MEIELFHSLPLPQAAIKVATKAESNWFLDVFFFFFTSEIVRVPLD